MLEVVSLQIQRNGPASPSRNRVWRPRFAVTAARVAIHGALAGLAVSANGASSAESVSAKSLRIVSWDLAGAPNIRPNKALEAARPAWRTTFGSERRTQAAQEKKVTGPLAIDADVVLLQGLTSMRMVRRLFPARDWRLVVSRQILERDDPLDPWSQDAMSIVPTTAVAVRYQQDIRVTAQDHLMELAAPEPPSNAASTEKPAAGTAVRISAAGQTLWVVSVAFTQSCLANVTACAARENLESWRRIHRIAGDLTLVGGRLTSTFSGMLPPPPCDGQAIEADPKPPSAEPATGERTLDPTAGCLVHLNLAR